MNTYLDIRLLPDPEFTPPLLMNVLFGKLHHVLVQLDNQNIGISFPEVEKTNADLGNKLRLHGPEEELKKLMEQNWLKGMRDHIETGKIKPVPEGVLHCRIERVQVKSNAYRLRRRYLKRHPEATEEEVNAMFPDSAEKRLKLPYLQVKSQSSGQRFCLFLKHLTPQQKAAGGKFNKYGLSGEATVPWF